MAGSPTARSSGPGGSSRWSTQPRNIGPKSVAEALVSALGARYALPLKDDSTIMVVGMAPVEAA